MVLKEKGKKLRDYSSRRPKIAFELAEGALTYDPDAEGMYGTQETWNFSDKIRKGDHVAVSEDSTRDRIIMKKFDSDDDEFIAGVVITEPKWKADPDGNITEAPRQDMDAGTYKGRTASIRLFGHDVKELPVAPSNTAIGVDDGLKYDPDNGVYVTGGSSIIPLFPLEANKGGTIASLVGFFNVLE